MEQLNEAQQTAVRKSSSDRLRALLMKVGLAEEFVMGMTRDDLMQKYAELLIKGTEPEAEVRPSIDPELEKARFVHEERMKQMEIEAQERLQREKNALEQERLAIERMKVENEKQIKVAEMKAKEKDENDEVKLLKRYGEALAQVVSVQTDDITDLPAWFRGVEDQYDKLKIPEKFRARLIYKYLSAKSRSLCARLNPEVRDNYLQMKQAIMKEYGLTAKSFLGKYNSLKKGTSDTHVLFCSKLQGLLGQYLQARGVKDYESLIALLVSDRLKSSLNDACLRHVMSIESAMDEPHWLKPERLAIVIDEYVANVGSANRVASTYIGQPEFRRYPIANGTNFGNGRHDMYSQARLQEANRPQTAPQLRNRGGKRCNLCGSAFHLQARYDKASPVPRVTAKHVNSTAAVSGHQCTAATEPVSLNEVRAHVPGNESHMTELTGVNVSRVGINTVDSMQDNGDDDHCLSGGVSKACTGSMSCTDPFDDIATLFADCDVVAESSGDEIILDTSNVQFDIHKLIANLDASMHYVDLKVQDEQGTIAVIPSLFDSGSAVSILRADSVKHLTYTPHGKVILQAFDNKKSVGDLITLNVSLGCSDNFIPVNFVVCSEVSHDALLSLSDYRRLLSVNNDNSSVMTGAIDHVIGDNSRPNTDETLVDRRSDGGNATCDGDSGCSQSVNKHVTDDIETDGDVVVDESSEVAPLDPPSHMRISDQSEAEKLILEQQTDESLTGAFNLAREGKGGFVLRKGLLFHKAKILSNVVERIVVPVSRRKALLDLAHAQVGCHMGIKRTKERLALNFMWPSMTKDVVEYCQYCDICQKRAPITYRDRVPIQGGVVSTEPIFGHFYVDCFGPLCSYNIPFQYGIVFLDHTSRWPHVVPLRNLTAKSCCEAMISLWQFTGFPTKVSFDQAQNFKAEITREFLKRVGCSPIWCTPRHPEANSVERTVGTIKSMISKVAAQYPKQWQKFIDLIMWAMRESVNETTGLAPYTMVYGRLPHGPLAILKDIWVSEAEYPSPKTKSAVDFLKDLRERLEVARSYAESHATKAQERYVERYNLRSREKSFTVGEQVLVLQKNSTASKVFSQWIPAVVIDVRSPHSYTVEFDDGSRRVLHANHLRKFYVRVQCVTYDTSLMTSTADVNSCVILNEQDNDFG